jgi:hypothetical protein
MQTHGPSCLEGPITGDRPWWAEEQFRADLVTRVKNEIAAGTYDTPEKWEIALGRLLQDLQED